jgi:hypothetical protein
VEVLEANVAAFNISEKLMGIETLLGARGAFMRRV